MTPSCRLSTRPATRGRDDVVGLYEPRASALKPLERAGAKDQDNVAAVGFEPLQRLFGAVAHPAPRQFDDAPVLKAGDQRGLARLGEIAGGDVGVAEPVEHAAVD